MALWSLKLLRVLYDRPQCDLARAAGFTQTYISRLENGATPQSASDVSTLAAALDVTAAVLTAKAITVLETGEVRVARG